MARVLVVDDEARAKVQSVIAYAHEHIYNPSLHQQAPGENPGHVAALNSFRCVFSFTVDRNGDLYRHLSVSVPSKDYANPVAISEIAGLFGFSGSRRWCRGEAGHRRLEDECQQAGALYRARRGNVNGRIVQACRAKGRMGRMTIVLRLTRSQQMALVDILIAYCRLKDEPQEFVDVVKDCTTTTGELLALVADLREVELEPRPR
jgi:hypothetical protein